MEARQGHSSQPADTVNEETRDEEELVVKCIEVIRQEKRASISLFQRRFRLGYAQASRIMDILEKRGIVGPATSTTQPRRAIFISDNLAIRIGSRWRNKTHGFVMRLTSADRRNGVTIIQLFEDAPSGLSWNGVESELLQQWEEIEP